MSRQGPKRASETTPLLTYPFLKADIDEEAGRTSQAQQGYLPSGAAHRPASDISLLTYEPLP